MEENWLNGEYVDYYNREYATSKEEFAAYRQRLSWGQDDVLLDLGCGDGTFLELVAPEVRAAWGVDISPRQVSLANARLQPFPQVQAVCADFTQCHLSLSQGAGQPLFTRVFSRKALHHLLDEEKAQMLASLSPLLASGAQFYLEDGIFFSFEREQLRERWDELMDDCARYYGTSWERKRHDLEHSFLAEHPTGIGFWTRELAKVGFKVQEVFPLSSFYGALLAVKA